MQISSTTLLPPSQLHMLHCCCPPSCMHCIAATIPAACATLPPPSQLHASHCCPLMAIWAMLQPHTLHHHTPRCYIGHITPLAASHTALLYALQLDRLHWHLPLSSTSHITMHLTARQAMLPPPHSCTCHITTCIIA